MTREEFYLQAVLAMAANPNFVEVKTLPSDEIETEECIVHSLSVDEIMMDAAELLKDVEREYKDVFDESQYGFNNTINSNLKQIAENLDDIRKGTDCIGENY